MTKAILKVLLGIATAATAGIAIKEGVQGMSKKEKAEEETAYEETDFIPEEE